MRRVDPNDEAFKRKVKAEFKRALDDAQRCRKMTVEEFARSLGITRAGVYKILGGKTIPSLRVLRKARKYWNVRLTYGDFGDGYTKARKADPRQIEFQFPIGDISKDRIEVERVSPKPNNSVQLVIRIDLSRTA
jgi:transcriptional regulator with XRE-family HTH domain